MKRPLEGCTGPPGVLAQAWNATRGNLGPGNGICWLVYERKLLCRSDRGLGGRKDQQAFLRRVVQIRPSRLDFL